MVKEDAVAGVQTVGLAVVDSDPVSVEFGHPIGGAGIKRGVFRLGDLSDFTKEFAGGSLVNACFPGESQQSYGLQEAEGPHPVGIGHIFRRIETHHHVAHGRQVVNFIGLHLLDDPRQVHRIGHIAVMEGEIPVLDVGVLIDMVYPLGIEEGTAPFQSVYHIPFFQEELAQVGTILSGDTSN